MRIVRFTREAMSILMALVTSASMIAACSATPDDSRYMEASDAAREYLDESKLLELAPGWSWPANRSYRERDEKGDPIFYEVNLGRVDAAWYWHCSWGRSFLAAANPAEREMALAKVLELRESAFYRWGLEETERVRRDKVLQDVAAGSTDQFRQIIELNCPNASE